MKLINSWLDKEIEGLLAGMSLADVANAISLRDEVGTNEPFLIVVKGSHAYRYGSEEEKESDLQELLIRYGLTPGKLARLRDANLPSLKIPVKVAKPSEFLVLDVSLSHIKEFDYQRLEQANLSPWCGDIIGGGFLLHVPPNLEELNSAAAEALRDGYDDSMTDLVRMAYRMGYSFILGSGNGAVYPELPAYDW